MANHTERDVKIYDFSLGVARAHGTPLAALQAVDFERLCQAVTAAAAARNHICDEADSSRRRLYLMDAKVSRREKYLCILWTLADPNTAAQMYLSRTGGRLRPAEKTDDDDVAISAHMIIDFDTDPTALRYGVGLEDHEGISRTRIQSLFDAELKKHLPEVTGITPEGQEKVGAPRLMLSAHPGQMMKEGEMIPAQIEIVRQIPRRTMVADHADPYIEISERRVLKLVREGPIEQLQTELVAFVRRLKRKYPEHRFRVRWRNSVSPEVVGTTQVEPQERPERLLERAMTRTVTLSGFRNLPDASETIVDRLASRMLGAVREVGREGRPQK
ncbi:hypothetical protein [Muricoccus aerilatus]|uniref:hypothetical protein n=1 Tax=Muricoccus aerilatus TaxID=452982 RepID=UPI0012EC29C3|nr:hypothetical protein [Roseomonas aerilata]